MTKFSNCMMSAGKISLKFKNGVTTYNAYGYVLYGTNEEGEDLVIIQPADLRRNPVMEVPVKNVEFVTIDL